MCLQVCSYQVTSIMAAVLVNIKRDCVQLGDYLPGTFVVCAEYQSVYLVSKKSSTTIADNRLDGF